MAIPAMIPDDKERRREIAKVTQVIDLWIAERLKRAQSIDFMLLDKELHAWARAILQKEGAPYEKEGAPSPEEGAPSNVSYKIRAYLPHRLIKLAHSHPLWAKIETELNRRYDLWPPLSIERETEILLRVRANSREKGWTVDIESK